MARIEASVTIKRPVEEVFDLVTDIAKTSQWRSGISESSQTSEGPLGVGATMRVVARVMGRQLKTTLEVTEYEPNRKYSTRSTSGPIPYETSYTFEPVAGGTRVIFVGDAQLGGFLKLIEPLVVRQQRRQSEAAFGKLKDLLEAQAEGSA